MPAPTITTHAAQPQKGALMPSTLSSTESEVREFAREFSTPNVQQMVTLAEAGRITWEDAHRIAQRALAAGMAAVA